VGGSAESDWGSLVAGNNQDITRLLKDVHEGRGGALDDLMKAVYDDLQHVAERHMTQRFGHDLPGVTMEPAALVNESFLKIIKQRNTYDNRGQFFAIATRIMLRVLVDYQRQRAAGKRGGDLKRITLSLAEGPLANGDPVTDTAMIEVDTLVGALGRLEELDTRKSDVVKMKVVWGLQMGEIAHSLGVSLATVERDWAFSKAWLARDANTARD
jgi:RNA polymerase sigma-70 factor (ECF subfamily)